MTPQEKILSVSFLKEEVDNYYLTTASWENVLGGLQYETGLRHKDGSFTLIQYSDRRFELIHSLIKQLVRLCYSPSQIQEIIFECERIKEDGK